MPPTRPRVLRTSGMHNERSRVGLRCQGIRPEGELSLSSGHGRGQYLFGTPDRRSFGTAIANFSRLTAPREMSLIDFSDSKSQPNTVSDVSTETRHKRARNLQRRAQG